MSQRLSLVFDRLREYAAHVTGLPGRRPLRVLVVDDEEATRTFVDRVLRASGFETATAIDGLDALAVAQDFQPIDVVLTDLVMPSMSGDELARRLRKREPSVKVLYLTGFSDLLFQDRVTLWEDEAYLDKPCSASSLLQAVSLLACGRLSAPHPAPAIEHAAPVVSPAR